MTTLWKLTKGLEKAVHRSHGLERMLQEGSRAEQADINTAKPTYQHPLQSVETASDLTCDVMFHDPTDSEARVGVTVPDVNKLNAESDYTLLEPTCIKPTCDDACIAVVHGNHTAFGLYCFTSITVNAMTAVACDRPTGS